NSFENGDVRKDLIITDYVNKSGNHIQLLGRDKSLSLKYGFDSEASGAVYGNDIPVIRYADILLSRAEALNEVNGPSLEVIDLINKVRERAGVSPLILEDYSKESFRAAI